MKTALLTLALAALAGCASHPEQRVMQAPPFYVPTTAMAQARPHPYQVLSGPDEEMIILRDEKVAFGSTSLSAASAFTIYTYDAQPISIRHSGGTGYQYRWLVQEGVSVPPNP